MLRRAPTGSQAGRQPDEAGPFQRTRRSLFQKAGRAPRPTVRTGRASCARSVNPSAGLQDPVNPVNHLQAIRSGTAFLGKAFRFGFVFAVLGAGRVELPDRLAAPATAAGRFFVPFVLAAGFRPALAERGAVRGWPTGLLIRTSVAESFFIMPAIEVPQEAVVLGPKRCNRTFP